jgi:hypothetical protein
MAQSRQAIIYDPRKMFLLAEEFLRATHLLAESHRQPNPASNPWVPHPTITLHAMALELYFKCLYLLDHNKLDRRTRTHDLKKLFDFLKPETQEKIRDNFDPTLGQHVIDDFQKKQKKRGLEHIGLPRSFNFDFALYCSSGTFEWIRYAYERQNRPSEQWYGKPILDAARKVILSRNPIWSSMATASATGDHYILATSPSRSVRRPPDGSQ